MANEAPIESLRNLGSTSCRWLRDVGITTIAELQRLGPVVAYRIVKQSQPAVSRNLLWALAAGLEGQDWREIPESTKQQLCREAEEP